MPLDDRQNEAVDRLLGRRSNRGLRRSLSALGGNDAESVIQSVAAQYDPARFGGAFKDALARVSGEAMTARTLNERDAVQQELRGQQTMDPRRRDLLRAKLDMLPKWGSAAERFDPRDQFSAASRFGNRRSLFRSL